MSQGKILEGVFAINKPTGISSAQVLRDCQTHFNPSALFAPWLAREKSNRDRENKTQRRRRRDKELRVKIGHGGTLDPLATGVLITGVGKGTKDLQDFLLCTKQYEAVFVFGASTDTYDKLGKVLRRAPYEHVTKEVVDKALGQFRGKFMQLPPLYSALKMDGKPLYEYAREGKPIPREIERRQVEVLELEMIQWMEPGSHEHKAPEETGSEAEMKIATQLWEQEKVLPAAEANSQEDGELENFETRKRKLSDAQDELVQERPASKQQKHSSQDATMSGALDPTIPADLEPQSLGHSSVSNQNDKGPPAVRLRMTVTSGFYVRSLGHDLGAAVGSAACMTELERTRQGNFKLGENVLEYSDLTEGENIWGPKISNFIEEWNGKKEQAKQSKQSPSSSGAKQPLLDEQPTIEAEERKTELIVKRDGVEAESSNEEIPMKVEENNTGQNTVKKEDVKVEAP